MVIGYFYNSVEGDRKYNGNSVNQSKRPFYKDGVFAGHLEVTAKSGGMAVIVAGGEKTGFAWINAHTIQNTTPLTLDISQASGTLNRIDRVVLRNDETERKPSIYVLEGAFSSAPVAPELTNTDSIQEKCLAQIYVKAGAVEITQADITDTRTDPNLCGLVASQIQELDFSQWKKQFDSYFEQFKENQETEWNEWFDSIKGNLSEDAAGNLQNQIDENRELSKQYTDQKVGQLVNGAPETLDTLKEVADAIAQNKNVVDALNAAIGTKADSNHSHAWGSLPGTPSAFPPAPHTHDYLPHSGGTVNGNLAVIGNLSCDKYFTATPDKTMVFETGGFMNLQVGQSAQVRNQSDTGWAAISAREFVQQSSKRYKENIEEMTEEYAKKLLELRPVSYDYKNKADGVGCYGLIAEEVDAVESYPVFYNDDHAPEGIDYSKFVPQIIKLLQIYEREIRELKNR